MPAGKIEHQLFQIKTGSCSFQVRHDILCKRRPVDSQKALKWINTSMATSHLCFLTLRKQRWLVDLVDLNPNPIPKLPDHKPKPNLNPTPVSKPSSTSSHSYPHLGSCHMFQACMTNILNKILKQ